MRAITADSIAERLGIWTTSADIQMIDNASMTDVTRALDDAMARKSGHPFFNPRNLRMRDFDIQYFKARYFFYGGDTGVQCLLISRQTGKEMISAVDLWPRNDFWAILVELSRLG